MSKPLSPTQKEKLIALSSALIDQENARVLVTPQSNASGYWFGGGNVIVDPHDGSILICGRYRNYGDSRTGTGAGARGLELAIFRAPTIDGDFEKIASFSKADLTCDGREVVSIEGVALHAMPDGSIELFISTEKDALYPDEISGFQKPGTGVWSIDRIHADRIENLTPSNIEEIVPFGAEFGRLHCKDPVVTDLPNGDFALIYCTHPFTWSSSGSALMVRKAGAAGNDFQRVSEDLLRRGPVWDIAAARITERLPVPTVGAFADGPECSIYFYDSCESLRQLDENPTAVARPRGWSCEELGGIAVGVDAEFPALESITINEPLFVSPHGTGCSRYIATLATEDGIFANWQQSQPDQSQPLVGHFLPMDKVREILS